MSSINQQNSYSFNDLAEELSNLGRSLLALSRKFELVASSQKVKSIHVSPQSHPDLFDKKLIAKLKAARKEFAKGGGTNYLDLRKSLGFK